VVVEQHSCQAAHHSLRASSLCRTASTQPQVQYKQLCVLQSTQMSCSAIGSQPQEGAMAGSLPFACRCTFCILGGHSFASWHVKPMQRAILQQYRLESGCRILWPHSEVHFSLTSRLQAVHSMTGRAASLCVSKSSVKTQDLCDHWTLIVHSNNSARELGSNFKLALLELW